MVYRLMLVTLLGLIGVALVLQTGCAGCNDAEEDDDVSQQSDDDSVEDLPTFRGMWTDLEISSSGEILVAYYDALEGGLGVARKGDATADWVHEQVDGYTYTSDAGLPVNPGDRGRYLDMVLDSSDTPHIAYWDADTTSLMYATTGADGWYGVVVDGNLGSQSVGTFNSIAIDAGGIPNIVYYDTKEAALKLARQDGGWLIETVDEGELLADGLEALLEEPDVGKYGHLAIDGGSYYIAYYDVANGNLKMAVGTPGSWTVQTLAGDQDGDKGAWPYLYPLGSSAFLVAFHDVGNQDLLLGRYEGGGLHNVQVIDDGAFVGADSVIADVNGLRILYFDGQNNDVKMAIDNGGDSWTLSTLISDGALGFSNNLVFHGGMMHVATGNYTTGDFHYEAISP